MPKKMDMAMHGECCCEMHKRAKGIKMLILGLLIVANAYLNIVSWWQFAGILVALAGLMKMLMPMHRCE